MDVLSKEKKPENKLFLPTEEELRAEVETQKTIFYLQHPELKEQ